MSFLGLHALQLSSVNLFNITLRENCPGNVWYLIVTFSLLDCYPFFLEDCPGCWLKAFHFCQLASSDHTWQWLGNPCGLNGGLIRWEIIRKRITLNGNVSKRVDRSRGKSS